MRGIWTITKKELKTFLYSPIAYILTAFFLLVSGFFFYNILAWATDQTMRMMQAGYGMNRININQMIFMYRASSPALISLILMSFSIRNLMILLKSFSV